MGGGAGEGDMSPSTYLASCRHQGPLTTPKEIIGGEFRPNSRPLDQLGQF